MHSSRSFRPTRCCSLELAYGHPSVHPGFYLFCFGLQASLISLFSALSIFRSSSSSTTTRSIASEANKKKKKIKKAHCAATAHQQRGIILCMRLYFARYVRREPYSWVSSRRDQMGEMEWPRGHEQQQIKIEKKLLLVRPYHVPHENHG